MENKYQKILEPMELPCGAVLDNRIVMSPMLVFGSEADGTVSEDDLKYFEKRTKVAGLIVTGAMFVNDAGHGNMGQLGIAHDKNVQALSEMVQLAKRDGNKIIAQLFHGGRESRGAFERKGRVIAPSQIKFAWLPYEVEEMTEEEIEQTIKDFGLATKRAIDAGFDGVEIHGANHYLIQQFFSDLSNLRTDKWGGTLDKKMAFALAIVDEVNRIAEEYGKSDFIVGYRICPEEIHGEAVGYRIDESIQLIEKIVEKKIDYIHLSLLNGYQDGPEGSDKSYGQIIMEQINGRCPVIIVSDILNADDAVNAREHGDMVAIGRAALIDPEFTEKIKEQRTEEIYTSVEGRVEQLAIPKTLLGYYQYGDGNTLPKIKGLNC